jgi:hypothetical protein
MVQACPPMRPGAVILSLTPSWSSDGKRLLYTNFNLGNGPRTYVYEDAEKTVFKLEEAKRGNLAKLCFFFTRIFADSGAAVASG